MARSRLSDTLAAVGTTAVAEAALALDCALEGEEEEEEVGEGAVGGVAVPAVVLRMDLRGDGEREEAGDADRGVPGALPTLPVLLRRVLGPGDVVDMVLARRAIDADGDRGGAGGEEEGATLARRTGPGDEELARREEVEVEEGDGGSTPGEATLERRTLDATEGEGGLAGEATLERRTLDAKDGEGGLAGEVDVLRAAGEADVGEDRLKRRREADGDDGSAAAEDARRVVFDPLIVAGVRAPRRLSRLFGKTYY